MSDEGRDFSTERDIERVFRFAKNITSHPAYVADGPHDAAATELLREMVLRSGLGDPAARSVEEALHALGADDRLEEVVWEDDRGDIHSTTRVVRAEQRAGITKRRASSGGRPIALKALLKVWGAGPREPGRLSAGLLNMSLRWLPIQSRARYFEEWRAELYDIPRRRRWSHALRLLVRAKETGKAIEWSPSDGIERQRPW